MRYINLHLTLTLTLTLTFNNSAALSLSGNRAYGLLYNLVVLTKVDLILETSGRIADIVLLAKLH